MANLELRLISGEALNVRVDDAEDELDALKTRTGRFAGEFTELTGPAIGIVRTDAIIAVVVR